MVGNANLADPVQRAALAANTGYFNSQLLPFPDWGSVKYNEYVGTSNYHSMQLTLNRQLGKSLQYFLTYTFSKALGTAAVNESDGDASIDPLNSHNTYGILPYDRTHIFNLSYNYNLPKLARGSLNNWFTRGVLNGWQMSGITTYQSGKPMRLKFGGPAETQSALFAYFGHTVTAGGNTGQASGIAPVFLRNPMTGNSNLNAAYFDLSALAAPDFGGNGPSQSPFYLRSPNTNNWDVTFFKNFNISETKKFQFRAGFFNIFNEAFANPDQGDFGNLTINTDNKKDPQFDLRDPVTHVRIPGSSTTCFQIPIGTPRGDSLLPANGDRELGTGPPGVHVPISGVCDPTKGFIINQSSLGVIQSKHGHRRVELAFKFYF
jgi:hypothetical protein